MTNDSDNHSRTAVHRGARARLQVAPGDGYVTRRTSALLYTSAGGLALVDAFNAAAEPDVIDAVTECAESGGFVDGPFVVITWHGPWRLALYGDIEVESDHTSLSRLSGVSSSTWVERQLRTAQVTIGVHPATADDHTDLEAGTVSAGGFAVSLTPTDTSAPTNTATSSNTEMSAEMSADSHQLEPEPRVPVSEPLDATPRVSRPSTELTELIGLTASRDDVTIDVPDDLLTHGSADPSPNAGWRLRFIDGPVEHVDGALLIGRRPAHDSPDDDARLVKIDCSLVSATHLRVEVEERGDLVVTDLGSSNGTWVATSGDGQPMQLEAHRRAVIETGTPVQIGSQVFVVERQ